MSREEAYNKILNNLGRRVLKSVAKGGAVGGVIGGGAGYLSAKQRPYESDKDFKKRKLKWMAGGGALGAGVGATAQAFRFPHHIEAWAKETNENAEKERKANAGYEGYQRRKKQQASSGGGGGGGGFKRPKERPKYESAGFSPKHTYEEAKRKYYDLAREHHPDRNNNSKESAERMKEINDAWESWKDHFHKTGSLFGEKLSDAQKNRLKRWKEQDARTHPSEKKIQNRLKRDPELTKQHMGGRAAARGALSGAIIGGVVGLQGYQAARESLPGISLHPYFYDPKRTARIGAYGAAIGATLLGGASYMANQKKLQKPLSKYEKEEHMKEKTNE